MQRSLRLALSILAVQAFAILPSGRLAAQTDLEPWLDSFYPIVSYSGNDGVSLGLRYAWRQRAAFDANYFYKASFLTDLGISASGSYLAVVHFKAPGKLRGWRFDLSAHATRQSRYEFFGLGEGSTYHADSITDTQEYYYKVRRAQLGATGEASRRLVKHLWLTGMAQWRDTKFTDLPGPSLFNAAYGQTLHERDAVGRVGLAFDARDNDYDTHSGVLVEGGLLHGTGDGTGYDRWMVETRGWVPFGEWRSTWLAIRGVASATSGEVPLDARLYLPVWEGQVRVLGGAESHRGMLDQRFVGRGLLFGNLTLHHDLLNAGGLMAAGLIAFADAGRVFEEHDFSLTTEGMQFGAGAGGYFRMMQTGIYTFNFAKGPDGFVFTLGNNWMF